MKRLLASLVVASLPAVAAAQNPAARGSVLSPVDCPSVNDMVLEYDPGPLDRTYLRVQHMGDPGTRELAEQVAYAVTWNVGAVTGLDAGAEYQRGYRDEPPPVGTSAFQLACESAGFFINTWQFSHRSPLVGEGPNVSVVRQFSRPIAAFRDGASIVIEGTVRVPWVRNQRTPVVTEGTAQTGFFYYARDSRSGTVIAHLLGIFDNRTPGTNGAGVENWGSDGIIAFVSSPIATIDGRGDPVRFLTPSVASASMQYQRPFAEARRYAAFVTPDNFRAALELLHSGPLPNISTDPADYTILSFGLLGEVFPGTGDDDNVALGASVTGLALRAYPLAGMRVSGRR